MLCLLLLIFCISEFLLHNAKPDLTLVDVNNNTALHLACSKVTYTHAHNLMFACSGTYLLIYMRCNFNMFRKKLTSAKCNYCIYK